MPRASPIDGMGVQVNQNHRRRQSDRPVGIAAVGPARQCGRFRRLDDHEYQDHVVGEQSGHGWQRHEEMVWRTFPGLDGARQPASCCRQPQRRHSVGHADQQQRQHHQRQQLLPASGLAGGAQRSDHGQYFRRRCQRSEFSVPLRRPLADRQQYVLPVSDSGRRRRESSASRTITRR